MTTHTPSVVVGVDGSEHAELAAHVAAAEAVRRQRPLRLLRAFTWTEQLMPGLPDTLAARAAARRSANAALDRLRRELTASIPGWTVGATLVEGRPETALCRAVEADDLLVVGASGTTWGSTGVLGTVAETVAAAAPCAVLVHRPLAALHADRHEVLAGVDGGPGTAAVLAAAAQEAEANSVSLAVVHAWRQLTEDAPASLRWRLDRDATERTERDAVEPAVAELRRRHPGLEIDVTVAPGRAGRVLVQFAETARMLVVGRRCLADGGPGATVHSVLHQAAVPVLVVPVATPAMLAAVRPHAIAATS